MERKVLMVAWDIITRERERGGLGLRIMQQLNSAYLMKLGRRIVLEPKTLWARVLKDRYCQKEDLEVGRGRQSTSNARKGIMEAFDQTKKGIGHAIEEGRQTNFWTHRWIDD